MALAVNIMDGCGHINTAHTALSKDRNVIGQSQKFLGIVPCFFKGETA